MTIGYLDGFHGQLNVFSPFVDLQVSVEQFVPNLGFSGVFPLPLNLNDTAPGAANPRHVFRHLCKDRPGPEAGFTHPVTKQRRLGPADQAKFTTKSG